MGYRIRHAVQPWTLHALGRVSGLTLLTQVPVTKACQRLCTVLNTLPRAFFLFCGT